MLRALSLLLVFSLAMPAHAAVPDDAETEAREVVAELGRLNGLALACRQAEVAVRAKRLMIDHVPKLREWGEIYETATNAAFLTPPGGCPDAATTRVQLEVVAVQLAKLLPASPPPVEASTPEAGIAPRYILEGPDGKAVMDSDFHGRFQLITFGYTYCPDVCPTTLVEMAQVLKALGDDAARIKPIFISVDPERDTPAVLRTYTAFFDQRILGLTGSPELIRRVADSFKVRYQKVQAPGASHYSIDHSASTYLLGPQGEFIAKFAYGTSAADVAVRVREAMQHAPARTQKE